MITGILGVALVAATTYAIYKHLTLADIKAEIAKIEGEIAAGALAAEIKTAASAIIARLVALL
jgi:hypothetical protein